MDWRLGSPARKGQHLSREPLRWPNGGIVGTLLSASRRPLSSRRLSTFGLRVEALEERRLLDAGGNCPNELLLDQPAAQVQSVQPAATGHSIVPIHGPIGPEGNFGTTPFVFDVMLSESSSQTVTVSYASGPHTATAPTDYQETTASATFLP